MLIGSSPTGVPLYLPRTQSHRASQSCGSKPKQILEQSIASNHDLICSSERSDHEISSFDSDDLSNFVVDSFDPAANASRNKSQDTAKSVSVGAEGDTNGEKVISNNQFNLNLANEFCPLTFQEFHDAAITIITEEERDMVRINSLYNTTPSSPTTTQLRSFLLGLATCHTVLVRDENRIKCQSPLPSQLRSSNVEASVVEIVKAETEWKLGQIN